MRDGVVGLHEAGDAVGCMPDTPRPAQCPLVSVYMMFTSTTPRNWLEQIGSICSPPAVPDVFNTYSSTHTFKLLSGRPGTAAAAG
jgi:hypothetical protein